MTRPFALSLSALLALTTLACEEEPCDLARYGCGSGTSNIDFELDPTCTLEGELEVEFGGGEERFITLAEGEMPELHFGSQGSFHSYYGVRVYNAELTRYDTLSVQFQYELCEGEPEVCEFRSYSQFVLGSERTIRTHKEGFVEEHGLLIFGPGPGSPMMRLQVEDPCGRVGYDLHRTR